MLLKGHIDLGCFEALEEICIKYTFAYTIIPENSITSLDLSNNLDFTVFSCDIPMPRLRWIKLAHPNQIPFPTCSDTRVISILKNAYETSYQHNLNQILKELPLAKKRALMMLGHLFSARQITLQKINVLLKEISDLHIEIENINKKHKDAELNVKELLGWDKIPREITLKPEETQYNIIKDSQISTPTNALDEIRNRNTILLADKRNKIGRQ